MSVKSSPKNGNVVDYSTNIEYRTDQVFGSSLMGTERKNEERKGKLQFSSGIFTADYADDAD
jgi:hypothetical protein